MLFKPPSLKTPAIVHVDEKHFDNGAFLKKS